MSIFKQNVPREQKTHAGLTQHDKAKITFQQHLDTVNCQHNTATQKEQCVKSSVQGQKYNAKTTIPTVWSC